MSLPVSLKEDVSVNLIPGGKQRPFVFCVYIVVCMKIHIVRNIVFAGQCFLTGFGTARQVIAAELVNMFITFKLSGGSYGIVNGIPVVTA